MRTLHTFLPEEFNFKFMKYRVWAFPLTAIFIIVSIILFSLFNLNYGIDFKGGTLIEIKTEGKADIAAIRSAVGGLGLGNVEVQEFGAADEILIRVEQQPGGDGAQQAVIDKVRTGLDTNIAGAIEYRRTEVVGPRVSGELKRAGAIAVFVALLAVLIYIWVRFEWQFAIGAIVATVHDVILTIGMFAALQLDFNLSSIAAILTIVGYSLNDTVVIYDRVRENLRKYKKKPLSNLLDLSINQMLTRTILTSVTTLLALFSLFIFGGEVIRSFNFAMIWGVFVGTYSSIFVAAPILIYLKLRPNADGAGQVSEGNNP